MAVVDSLESRLLFSGATASAGPVGVGIGAPSVALKISPRNSKVGGTQTIVFTVTYRDTDGVDPTTIDSRDLRIAGPNGYVRYARLDNVDSNGDGTVRVARYKLSAPTNGWHTENAGTFSIRLIGASVADTQGNAVRLRTLATFTV